MPRLSLTSSTGSEEIVCAGLLFDMDGTLIDSRICVERKWRAWCARHGIDFEELLRIFPGRKNEDTIRLVAPHLDVAAEAAMLRTAEEACADGITALPGARQLLEALPADRWAVVTSAWRRLTDLRFDRAGLPLPRVIVTADDTAQGKPHPEGYLSAAAALGIDPAGCVVVEDAPSGVAAARTAGMRVIGIVSDGHRLDSDWTIGDFRGVRLIGR